MSKEKAAAILTLTGVDKSVYYIKRNLQSHWRSLSHEEWVEFCKVMENWFAKEALDEWDEYVKVNNARKAKSDQMALERVLESRRKAG